MPPVHSSLPSHEAQSQRTMDILAREVPYRDATDFVGACDVFAGVIAKEQPDIVLFPQRGAGPIEWTTEVLIEDSGNKVPTFVDIPIGTHIKVGEDRPRFSGISGQQKITLIRETIEKLIEDGIYIPGKSKIMLIDEVQKGGTITQASHAIRRVMDDYGDNSILSIVAAQDSRNDLLGDSRTEPYRKLAANERAGYKTTVVPTAMFMVDRPQFLDEIWRDGDQKATSLDEFVINNNEAARNVFKTLANVYLYPEIALDELDELRDEIVFADLGSTVLQSEVLEAMTDPRPVLGNRGATNTHLFQWWNNFAHRLQNVRAGTNQPKRNFEPEK